MDVAGLLAARSLRAEALDRTRAVAICRLWAKAMDSVRSMAIDGGFAKDSGSAEILEISNVGLSFEDPARSVANSNVFEANRIGSRSSLRSLRSLAHRNFCATVMGLDWHLAIGRHRATALGLDWHLAIRRFRAIPLDFDFKIVVVDRRMEIRGFGT